MHYFFLIQHFAAISFRDHNDLPSYLVTISRLTMLSVFTGLLFLSFKLLLFLSVLFCFAFCTEANLVPRSHRRFGLRTGLGTVLNRIMQVTCVNTEMII